MEKHLKPISPRPMFGLYFHIPFCQKKCSYCDFYSIENLKGVADFVPILMQEIDLRLAQSRPTPTVTSIFFGGGTPSLLPIDQLGLLMDKIKSSFTISDDCECTIECNPGTVTSEKLSAYREFGFNRLSFGVQSFNQSELDFLDRIHSAADAQLAVELARTAGFDNINIDVMFAVPGQTMDSWKNTLSHAMALRTEHISCYSLIYEEGTPLFQRLRAGEITAQTDDVDADMYNVAIETFNSHGFHQYEVSNFAQSGRECRHNCTYWGGGEYLAFGPSAHGVYGSTRYWNFRSLQRYSSMVNESRLPLVAEEVLTENHLALERFFVELRAKGIRLECFKRDFGIDLLEHLNDELTPMINAGLVVELDGANAVLRLTARGYAVCDEITIRLQMALERSTSLKQSPIVDAVKMERELLSESNTFFDLKVISPE